MSTSIKIKVKQWMTRTDNNPIPMRTMVGEILAETNRAIHVKLHGQPEPTSECLHCGRTLTHPVSLLYGIGPICGRHFHISPVAPEQLDEYMEEIRERLAATTWEGWIPLSQIEQLTRFEKNIKVAFNFNGKQYQTLTDKIKFEKIKKQAEIIFVENIS